MAPNLSFESSHRWELINIVLLVLFLILATPILGIDIEHGCSSVECFYFQRKNATNDVKINRSEDGLKTFCYDGLQKSLVYIWANPTLHITLSEVQRNENATFIHYYGASLSEVEFRREQTGYRLLQRWKASFQNLRETMDYSLNAFSFSCISIETSAGYKAKINNKTVEIQYVAYLVAGLIIFFCAKKWSVNTTLHYGTGVSVGVLASLILLLFLFSKVLPGRLKNLGYALMLMGTSVTFWMLSFVGGIFSSSVLDKCVMYWQYVVGYCIIMGLLSFAVVYRLGPVTNERTLNLIQWLLQTIGLILIYNSTQIREVSIALMLITLTVYNFPRVLFINKTGRKYWNRFFPPKIKLLTEDEYVQQGNIETKKALEQLREYCRSPDCQSWRIISRLKSPQRFADFIEGNSWHITNEEMLEYDSDLDMSGPYEQHPAQDIADDDDESEMDFVLSSP